MVSHPCEIVASEVDASNIPGVDRTVTDGEEILLGEVRLRFLLTPDHTRGGLCIIVDDEALLTGDTLFIGDCGRTDIGGSDTQMFQTLQRLKILPDHLIVYPGHDYGSKPFDTLGNQKKTNNLRGTDKQSAHFTNLVAGGQKRTEFASSRASLMLHLDKSV